MTPSRPLSLPQSTAGHGPSSVTGRPAAALCGLMLVILTAGCDLRYPAPAGPATPPPADVVSGATPGATPGAPRDRAVALSAFARVLSGTEPVAEATCRQANPAAPRAYCDFIVQVDQRPGAPPNAFQSLTGSGQPVITFTLPLLQTMANDDEIAFIFGHEAGHQIAGHIPRTAAQATLGGLVLGTIVANAGGTGQAISDAVNLGGAVGARVYSQEFELEADTIGTLVAMRAGYDARLGAQSFARYGGAGPGGLLATHPPTARRLAAVDAAARRIEATGP
jgi:Zn-dependent protease with chaperone function